MYKPEGLLCDYPSYFLEHESPAYFLTRSGVFNGHHLIPKDRGGIGNPQNMLQFDINRHIIWHRLFGPMTLEEVVAFCKKLDLELGSLTLIERIYWEFLFKKKSPEDVVRLLSKLKELKSGWKRRTKKQLTKRAHGVQLRRWKKQNGKF